MGDSWLTKPIGRGQSGLLFGQSVIHQDYFKWMEAELTSHITSTNQFIPKSTFNSKTYVRFRTVRHPFFTHLYEILYPLGKKTISWKYLENLTPLSLAVWAMDDGSLSVVKKQSCSFHFCSHGFSKNENEIIISFLKEVYGLKAKLGIYKEYFYIRLIKSETEKLIRLVRPHIIESMKYKIDLNRY